MYYCNELYSLCVLSLFEGEMLGRVDKLYFDKKLRRLTQIELIGENDAVLLLPTKNIYHIGKNAITVKNNLAVSLKVESLDEQTSPIGSKAYTIRGEYLGVVKEISLTDKFFVEKFSLDSDKTMDINSLASCGKNTIIFYEKTGEVNVHKFTPAKAPKTFKSKPALTTEILPISSREESQTPTEPQSQPAKNAIPVEAKKSVGQNSEFLLGRTCTKNIYNFNNELLVKEKAVITKKILKEVNRYGKLRELMLFSKQ